MSVQPSRIGMTLVGLFPGFVGSAWAQDGGAAPRPLSSITGAGLRELSPWSMFLSADMVVRTVMVGLALASLVTWTVFLAKTVEIARSRQRVAADLARIAQARSLRDAQTSCGPGVLARFLYAASEEVEASGPHASAQGVAERALSRFADIAGGERRAARRGMGALATIGSTAPFVGLFGTVWGIMNSFIGISKSQTTNLAVVAPGIAEALLATALGLVAAIPAVVIYNYFARATAAHLDLLNQASGAAARLLSRDLDRAAPGGVLTRAAE